MDELQNILHTYKEIHYEYSGVQKKIYSDNFQSDVTEAINTVEYFEEGK